MNSIYTITLFEAPEFSAAVKTPNPDCNLDIDSLKALYRQDVIIPTQTHSVNVAIVSPGESVFPDTDALISVIPGQAIGILTADCVPILIYAEDIKGVAAIHAGWRGSIGGIVDNTISRLCAIGADVQKMQVIFGPSICGECYEVDNDLAEKFEREGFGDCIFNTDNSTGRPHIDLQKVNIVRLIKSGIRPDNIILNQDCTLTTVDAGHRPLYPSYRRDKEQSLRLLTYIKFK